MTSQNLFAPVEVNFIGVNGVLRVCGFDFEKKHYFLQMKLYYLLSLTKALELIKWQDDEHFVWADSL